MTEPKRAQTSSPAKPAVDPLAEVEAMILRLTELRQREPGKDRRADYGSVIERLHALAYRLTEAGSGRTVGLPKPPTAPEPRAKPPQAALPLGPVIVRARKPRPR